ncbi:MAG: hypothetical protein B7733_06235 [Myxococcales bacterium FL481]|nr:MAG: hypothetical protein B7733_06235 [Myxococcales bacterium FL481]
MDTPPVGYQYEVLEEIVEEMPTHELLNIFAPVPGQAKGRDGKYAVRWSVADILIRCEEVQQRIAEKYEESERAKLA